MHYCNTTMQLGREQVMLHVFAFTEAIADGMKQFSISKQIYFIRSQIIIIIDFFNYIYHSSY
jgi:hypothetical protein